MNNENGYKLLNEWLLLGYRKTMADIQPMIEGRKKLGWWWENVVCGEKRR